jgi:hypothetical protein
MGLVWVGVEDVPEEPYVCSDTLPELPLTIRLEIKKRLPIFHDHGGQSVNIVIDVSNRLSSQYSWHLYNFNHPRILSGSRICRRGSHGAVMIVSLGPRTGLWRCPENRNKKW